MVVSIPFIAGQWSLPTLRELPRRVAALVSIPFIAGQWSLLESDAEALITRLFQSPSLRGSGRFKMELIAAVALAVAVSIPFIAGQWSLLTYAQRAARTGSQCFNPLHCGAVVASGPEGGG